MIDLFTLLTPVFALGILTLLGFIGCEQLFGVSGNRFPGDPPTFDPPAGGYFAVQSVTMSTDTSGAQIYYTLDGSDPTNSSTQYSGPISISTTTTIRARTYGNSSFSDVTIGQYYIGPIIHQQVPAETPTAGATTTNPFGNPLVQGNLIVVWIFYQSDTPQITAVTDTAGNTYQLAASTTPSPDAPIFQQEIWYSSNITTGSGVTVSVTLGGGTVGEVQISAHEYSNASQDNPLADAPPPGTTGPNGASVLSGSVNSSGRLIFGAAWFRGSGTPGPGFRQRSAIKNNVAEDMDIVTPGVAQAVFVNTSPTEDWIAQMITLT
jgi:hypothetical protein